MRIMRSALRGLPVLILGLTACGDEAKESDGDLQRRIEHVDEELELEPLSASGKTKFPKASTSSITLALRAKVTPPTVGGETLYASSVAVHDDLAFVSYHQPGADYGGAVDVLDISDPTSPQLVSSLSFGDEDVNDVDSDGSRVFLAVSGERFAFPETAAVRAYDLGGGVIDAASGQVVGLASFVASGVRAAGGRLFATTGDVGGYLVELDPALLTVTASVALDDARAVDVDGSHVAVHAGDEVRLLDASSLSDVADWSFTRANDDRARSELALVGEKAFVTAGSDGVHILDAATGTVLETIAVPAANALDLLPSEVVANGLTVVRDFAFIAQGGGGFHLAFTDRDPSTTASGTLDPYTSLSRVAFSDWASSNAVASSDDVILVANGSGGVRAIALEVDPCGAPAELPSQGFYSSDFNDDVDGWVPTYAASAYVPEPGVDWGGVQSEYHGGHAYTRDRLLSLYRSSNGHSLRWGRTFANDTGRTIRSLELTYDLELAWSRFDARRSRDGRLTFWVDGSSRGTSSQLDNGQFGNDDAVRWLCDDEMDALSSSSRGETTTLSGLNIGPGASFRLEFGFTSGRSAGRNVNIGIDNLVVEARP